MAIPHPKTKPSAPAKGTELYRRASPVKRSGDPPPYGEQHRQDARWEGGNGALPPMWREDKGGDDQPRYFDDVLFMTTSCRPVPGERLDYPGQLIPECEWHISPLGWSYFVNHNTLSTSWRKPAPERPAGSLMPECTIKCNNRYNDTLAYLSTSGNIMSTSVEGSIHQWTRAGKPVGKPCDGDGNKVTAMTTSLDETMVVCGSFDGRVRLWNIKEWSVVGDPWEGTSVRVKCLDWSPTGVEVAGGLEDGTIRRWNPATGRQITPLIKSGDERLGAVKYSPKGDKLAGGGDDNIIRVWSKDGELLVEIKGHDDWVRSICWSKDGTYIFSASYDRTIRKWQSVNGEEVVVFKGHTNTITSICLSPDESHLISASYDYSVRTWDLETNQQLGDPLWHDDLVLIVAMSSDGQYFTSAIYGPNAKIYVWNLEVALKRARGVDGDAEPIAELKVPARPRHISLVPRQQNNNEGLARYGNDFFGDGTNHTPRRSEDTSSPPGLRKFFSFLRPSDAPEQSIQLRPRRLNFSSFPVKISRLAVDVAPCRDDDRYGMVHETDEEAATAMKRTSSNHVDSSTAQGHVAAGVNGSQGRPMQTQSSTEKAGEFSYEVSCCSLPLLRFRRRKLEAV